MRHRMNWWIRLLTMLALVASLALPVVAAGPGSEGGGETTIGNNLSFPVIWSDGVTKTLRGTYGAPSFAGNYVTDADGTKWYLQQDANNTWQAQNEVASAPVTVSWIDWGDNLEAHAWQASSRVRVETTLLEDLTTPMTGFTMQSLYGSGASEMQGTNGVTYDSTQAIIFSGAARLTIQQITPGSSELSWDPAQTKWVGNGVIANPDSADGTYYNMAAYQTGDGPGYYTGEVNVSGKVVYGYNWTTPATVGTYRVTFSLDGAGFKAATGKDLNTTIGDSTLIASTEGETPTNTAQIDVADNLSFIDVLVEGATGGSGRDAQVVSVSAPSTVEATDGTVEISTQVKNNGAEDDTFDVTISETPGGYQQTTSVTVPAGQTITVVFDWPTTSGTAPGLHIFTVTASTVDDSDDTNNVAVFTIMVGNHDGSGSTCPNPTPVVQGMTARIINPTERVTGTVDATGCDIGVYFAPGTRGSVERAEIFGATSFGIYNNGATVNVTSSNIHDIINANDACGGDDSMGGSSGGMDEGCGGDDGGGGRRYIGGKSGTGILFLGSGANGTINRNTVAAFGRRGISISGPGAKAQIASNVVNGDLPSGSAGSHAARTGIWLANGASAVVSGNTISNLTSTADSEGASSGIMVAGGDWHNGMPNYTTQLKITGNRLTNDDVGVLLSNLPVNPNVATGNLVAGNVIHGPAAALSESTPPGTAPYYAGVKVLGGVGDRISGGTISGYPTPVAVDQSCIGIMVHGNMTSLGNTGTD